MISLLQSLRLRFSFGLQGFCVSLVLGTGLARAEIRPLPSSPDFYQRLGVGPDATREEIVNAYVEIMIGYPDNGAMTRGAQEAYENLIDPQMRDDHDWLLASLRRPISVPREPAETTGLIETFFLTPNSIKHAPATEALLTHIEQSIAKMRSPEALRQAHYVAIGFPPHGSDRPKYSWSPVLEKPLRIAFRNRSLQLYRELKDPVSRAQTLLFAGELQQHPSIQGVLQAVDSDAIPIDPLFATRLQALEWGAWDTDHSEWMRAAIWYQALREAKQSKNEEAEGFIQSRQIPRLVSSDNQPWPAGNDELRKFLRDLVATDFNHESEMRDFIRVARDHGSQLLKKALSRMRVQLTESESTSPKLSAFQRVMRACREGIRNLRHHGFRGTDD